jgi:hypothetical protein
MFGQNNDQKDVPDEQDHTNGFMPAPGAPAGPLDDSATPPTVDPYGSLDNKLDQPQTEGPIHSAPSDDLLNIKQDALRELKPLVGHLEQNAEEKFRTTMMMIQASDDHSLLQSAYDAAKQITDEKARAQALLDVVNEINYFTQHHDK